MIAARRHEIGVRLALGALPREVVRLVLGSGLGLTLAGVAVGLAGAMVLSRVLAGFVYGVSALDPASYAAAVVVLVGAATLAAYRPARTAAGMDPLAVLRNE